MPDTRTRQRAASFPTGKLDHFDARTSHAHTSTPGPAGNYDPDSSEPQPPGSLAALIGRCWPKSTRCSSPRSARTTPWTSGSSLSSLGRQRSLPIAIDITKGEQVLFHAALDGATPDNERWINAKKRTAAAV